MLSFFFSLRPFHLMLHLNIFLLFYSVPIVCRYFPCEESNIFLSNVSEKVISYWRLVKKQQQRQVKYCVPKRTALGELRSRQTGRIRKVIKIILTSTKQRARSKSVVHTCRHPASTEQREEKSWLGHSVKNCNQDIILLSLFGRESRSLIRNFECWQTCSIFY